MQNAKNKTGISKASQPAREHSGGGKRHPIKNGSKQGRTHSNVITGPGVHLLGKELRPLPLFELALMCGDDKIEPGLIKMIDTEAKQLQAIEDLYRIVIAQPKYKAMKEPNWKAGTKPVHILLWLLRKLGPLAEGNRWTVDTYVHKGKTRFRFVVFKDYHRQKLGHREEWIPLDFLLLLKKRDQLLHDMIVDLIALVSRENKIPLWDEDGDFSEYLKDLLNVPSGGYNVYRLERQHKIYSTGPARQYLRLIKQRRRIVSVKSVQQMLASYDAKSQRKQYAVWWIKKGLRLASEPNDIRNFSFIPNHVPGQPVTPFQQYKFVWSLHENDVLRIRTYHNLNKADEKFGNYFPVMFSVAKPGQVVKPVEYKSYPEDLFEFLDYAVKHFNWAFRDYYFKDSYKKPQTIAEELMTEQETNYPANKLLDAIEIADIRKEAK